MLRQGRGSSLGRNLRTSIEVIDGDDLSLPFFGMSSCMHLISGHTVLNLAVRILIQAKSKEWRNRFLHTFDIASFYAGSMSVHEFSVRLSPLQDFHTIAIHLGYEKFMSIIHVGVKILEPFTPSVSPSILACLLGFGLVGGLASHHIPCVHAKQVRSLNLLLTEWIHRLTDL
jgi:hypothetical protein